MVEKWFDSYEEILTELVVKDLPSNLSNFDETGLQDHFVSPRFVAEVGSAYYVVTADQKGKTTIALASFSVVTQQMLLLLIYSKVILD